MSEMTKLSSELAEKYACKQNHYSGMLLGKNISWYSNFLIRIVSEINCDLSH